MRVNFSTSSLFLFTYIPPTRLRKQVIDYPSGAIQLLFELIFGINEGNVQGLKPGNLMDFSGQF